MKFHLIVLNGQDAGRTIALAEGTRSLGRSSGADAQIDDRSVSRIHCEVSIDGSTVEIRDAGSSSGTFVNSEKVSRKALETGDEIVIGNTRLRVASGDSERSTFVERPDGGAPLSNDVDAWQPNLIGQTIHHYEVESRLADGRSGIIFAAQDTEKKRRVALKILRPEVSSNREAMQRFVRAMKTMFDLRHPNLVRIYNAGQTGSMTWVAMEYVDGESMAQVIERIGTAGMLDWDYALRVALHSARALEAAFERKIVHRNITPDNILMSSSDQVVKLGDMMLAKALEGNLAKEITVPGQLVGDLAYMSPEATSDASAADGRSDIYSLGATCYALLTGRPPFEERALPVLLDKIRSETPESPRKYQLGINEMFEGCVMRMLAKRPEDRFQSPTALLMDLERIAKFANIDVRPGRPG